MRIGSSVKAATPAPPVRVDVLGALRLTVGGEVVRVPGPKRGAVLAMLAIADDGAVAVDALLDALWADDLPETARATLYSHVSRLRGHLGPAGVRLEGRHGGYRLRLDGTDSGTDVAEARSLLAAARVASPADGVGLLREARSPWRGPPLAEFGEVAPLAASAVTLTELRRSVDEAYATCALEVGALPRSRPGRSRRGHCSWHPLPTPRRSPTRSICASCTATWSPPAPRCSEPVPTC